MLRKFKIDELLAFFVLSLTLLLVSWYTGIASFSVDEVDKYPAVLSLNHNLQINKSGNEIVSFEAYNPSYLIYYSVDGGDNFSKAGRSLNAYMVRMDDNTLYPSSYRWRPSASRIRTVKTVQLLVIDPAKKIRTEINTFVLNPASTDRFSIYLNTSHKGLFDSKDGLLVPGKSSWFDNGFQKSWYNRSANFTQRGIEWERKVNFQLYKGDECLFNDYCGLRISGNATRGFPQKSFRIKARKMYGSKKLDFGFFGEDGLKKYESLVIRHSGNDNNRTMFADAMMHELADGAKLICQKSKQVSVFINGNYWGEYNLRERIDRHLISKYENCKPGDITLLEGGEGVLKKGKEELRDDFLSKLDSWCNSENDPRTIEEIKVEISLKSFMDYLFFETFYGNNDWLNNNVLFYKKDGGEWRWILNDLDYSLSYPGQSNLTYNGFHQLNSSNSVTARLYQVLIQHDGFKTDFKERCEKNMKKYLSDDRIQEVFSRMKKDYEGKIQNQIDRWRVIDSFSDWEESSQKNLDFLLERKEIYREQLNDL